MRPSVRIVNACEYDVYTYIDTRRRKYVGLADLCSSLRVRTRRGRFIQAS